VITACLSHSIICRFPLRHQREIRRLSAVGQLHPVRGPHRDVLDDLIGQIRHVAVLIPARRRGHPFGHRGGDHAVENRVITSRYCRFPIAVLYSLPRRRKEAISFLHSVPSPCVGHRPRYGWYPPSLTARHSVHPSPT